MARRPAGQSQAHCPAAAPWQHAPEVPSAHVALKEEQVGVGAQLPHLCHKLGGLPVACKCVWGGWGVRGE